MNMYTVDSVFYHAQENWISALAPYFPSVVLKNSIRFNAVTKKQSIENKEEIQRSNLDREDDVT